MLNLSRKIQSSALLIAMVVGVVVSATLFGLVAATNQNIKSSGQARDGAVAYQAALSGIEDGLLRYRYALSQGKQGLIMRKFDHETNGTMDRFSIGSLTDAYYNLSIRMDSLTVGTDVGAVDWRDNASKALEQSALPLLSDNSVDIDLSYLLKENPASISYLEIQFSSPFIKTANGYEKGSEISKYFSALNYQILDLGASGEQQILKEDINKLATNYKFTSVLDSATILKCQSSTAQCHLKITPRVVLSLIGPAANGRLSGDQSPSVLKDKYVFIKIFAKSGEAMIEPKTYSPGTVVIESIGVFGEAKKRLQAQVDASNGRYLGLFDYGVYCGDKCVMP